MKRFITVAVATVLASSMLVACSSSASTTDSASSSADTKVEDKAAEEPVEAQTEEPAEELDLDGLKAELDDIQANYEASAEAAKAAGDEAEYAELGTQIADLLDEMSKVEEPTQEQIDAWADALNQINEALKQYGSDVADSAVAELETLQANAEKVDNYYAELGEYVEAAHDAGSFTDESYAEYKQYGNDLTSLGEAIGTALQSDDTTIADVQDMNATLEKVYAELETMAEGVGAEIATIQLLQAAAEEAETAEAEEAAAADEAAAEGEEEAAEGAEAEAAAAQG